MGGGIGLTDPLLGVESTSLHHHAPLPPLRPPPCLPPRSLTESKTAFHSSRWPAISSGSVAKLAETLAMRQISPHALGDSQSAVGGRATSFSGIPTPPVRDGGEVGERMGNEEKIRTSRG